MSFYVCKQFILFAYCWVMLVSCGEKVKDGGHSELEKPREGHVDTGDDEIVEYTFEAMNLDGGPVFKVSAQVYDAPALALGEIYSTRKQLEGAAVRKVADFTNLVNSGEVAELKCD